MILIRCQCGRKLRLRPEYAGRTGKCPACGREVQVPKDLPRDGDKDTASSSDSDDDAAAAAPARPIPATREHPVTGASGAARAVGAGGDAGPDPSAPTVEPLPDEDALRDAATEMVIDVPQDAAAAYRKDREARKQAKAAKSGGAPRPAFLRPVAPPPTGPHEVARLDVDRAGRTEPARPVNEMVDPSGHPAVLPEISRDATTAREPMRAPREALEEWIKRPGTGATPTFGVPELGKGDTLSLRGTAKRKGPLPIPGRPAGSAPDARDVNTREALAKRAARPGPKRPATSASGDPAAKGAVGEAPGAAAAPGRPKAGAGAGASAAPGAGVGERVDKTLPLRPAAGGAAGAGSAIPKTAERTVELAVAPIAADGPRGPWYQNETFVLLLLLFCYPLGVLGVFLGSAWATRAQKALAGGSLLGIAGLAAWLARG